MTYDLIPNSFGSQTIQLTDDDGQVFSIPNDERNADYQRYLTYIAANPWTPTQLAAQQAALDALVAAQTAEQTVTTDQETALATLVAGLSAQVAQAQTDLATLAANTDSLSPIIARVLEGVLGITQAVASLGVLDGHVDHTKIPKI